MKNVKKNSYRLEENVQLGPFIFSPQNCVARISEKYVYHMVFIAFRMMNVRFMAKR